MASISALSSLSFKPSFNSFSQVNGKAANMRTVPAGWGGNVFPSLKTSRFNISCAAKPETVEKVCGVVRKQLALPADASLTAESKFSELGADSLDTVEIVMSLEEEFGITVEEEDSQNIATVQDAAELIDTLIEKKG